LFFWVCVKKIFVFFFFFLWPFVWVGFGGGGGVFVWVGGGGGGILPLLSKPTYKSHEYSCSLMILFLDIPKNTIEVQT